eukprot:CAMPEP_0202439634 /NCGR_PEP_ID=MMETSP1345-20130828/36263_1 /ASSEMBLY_ACC=CAM_ASM_000843 /TAXON_ID=342563 /ORGANISM="Fabrea Fabrea salina" /LENGTH=84 /DNA_ID=CAMNT_0049054171 /DNA_START=1299 /DNA_END=1553 /DNA_ORIENTATION=-
MIQSSYIEGGIKKFTLLRPREEPQQDNLDDINSMLDIYREAFKHILEEDSEETPVSTGNRELFSHTIEEELEVPVVSEVNTSEV